MGSPPRLRGEALEIISIPAYIRITPRLRGEAVGINERFDLRRITPAPAGRRRPETCGLVRM